MDLDEQADPVERHRARGAVGRFFRNPRTDELTLAQRPNLPLAIYLVATAVRWLAHSEGTAATAVQVVATVALAWWAVDEVARGDSGFRRVLGAVVLAGLVIQLVGD